MGDQSDSHSAVFEHTEAAAVDGGEGGEDNHVAQQKVDDGRTCDACSFDRSY